MIELLSAVLGCTFAPVVALAPTVLLVGVEGARDPEVVLILKGVHNVKAVLQAMSEAREQVAAWVDSQG